MTTPGLGTHLRRLAVASWLGLYAVVWAQPAKPVPVSMDVQGADLVSLLHGMANAAGVHLVVASGVSGKVNLHLQDVPWRQALQAVLAVGGLQAQSLGGVWWVAPQAQVVERAKQEAVLRQAQQQNRRMVSATLALHYARAADLLQTLQKARTAAATTGAADKSGQAAVGWLSPGGVVLADLRTNQLFVQDYPEQLQAIEAFVQQVDVPLRQVMIEAAIVRAEQSFGESLGARLAWQRGNGNTGTRLGGTLEGVTGQSAAGVAPGVSLPATGLVGNAAASAALAVISPSGRSLLAAEISGLEQTGRGQLLSNPRVVTADRSTAVIEQGTEYPYQQAVGETSTAVAFRKANLRLEVTPTLMPEGNIMLEVSISNDSRGVETAQGMAINTRRVQSKVLVRDGGTVVIGGILEKTDDSQDAKVPVLGDVPLLGRLFRNQSQRQQQAEMLVFITPRLIDADGQPS
jgi:type IV pilus assembly protein PilQ